MKYFILIFLFLNNSYGRGSIYDSGIEESHVNKKIDAQFFDKVSHDTKALEFINCEFKDLSKIKKMSYLKILVIINCKNVELKHTLDLKNLEYFKLQSKAVINASLFVKFKKLKHLSFSQVKFENIQSLQKIPLESLELIGFKNDLTFISKIHTLKKLNVSLCTLKSLTFCKGLKSLQDLDASKNLLEDISSLSGCKELESVDLKLNTSLKTVVVLEKLPKLKKVDLQGTSVSIKDLKLSHRVFIK